MTLGNFGLGRRPAGGGGGGFPIRIVIAVVIAAIGVIGYYTKTSTNPVTGEDQRVGSMTAEQEIALGLQAAPEMAQQMGGVIDPRESREAQTVDRIGRQLAYETISNQSPYAQAKKFNFYLLGDAQTVNAFALPGGQVFITKALYDKLQNEAQLAGVLGHEVGHVIDRHGAQHMAKGQLGQSIVAAVAVGASDGSNRGQMAAMAAQFANQMIQLKYGREDELKSDSLGLRMMAELGYDPQEMIGVMEILKEASGGGGGRGPSMMQTHPYPDDRIAAIKAALEQYGPEWSKQKLSKGAPLH